MNRRDFIKTLGSGFAMAQAGIGFAAPTGGPAARVAGTIDCHSHIFNATDLPIAEFINTVKLKAPAWAPWRVIGDLVQRFAWAIAPTAREELAMLDQLSSTSILSAHTDGQPDRIESTWLAATEKDADERYRQFLLTLQEKHPADFERLMAEYDKQLMLHVVPQFRGLAKSQAAPRLVARSLGSPEEFRAFLEFDAQSGLPSFTGLKPFFRMRSANAGVLLNTFGGSDRLPVTAAITAMVDFDLWIGYYPKFHLFCHRPDDALGETKSRITDQLRVAHKINELFQGRIKTLAPFNPLRAAYDSDYVDLYRAAVTEYGVVGFKLYPPMGFSPWGNQNTVIPKCYPKAYRKIKASRIDTVLKDFYYYCAEQKVSLMAHCADSNEAASGAGRNAAPENWGKAIAAHSEVFGGDDPAVRVCLGHFGDDNSTQCSGSSGWTEKIVTLIQQHRSVYADFSYYDQLLGSDSDIRCLAQRLKPQLQGPVLRQLVYGSDWSMLGMQNDWGNYHKRFMSLLGSGNLGLQEDQIADICRDNAYRLYRRLQ